MTRPARPALAGILLFAVTACTDAASTEAGGCPDGTRRMELVAADPTGGPFETREQAVRARLRAVEKEASDEAVSAALIASTSGEDAGSERIVVETSEGKVTMVLVPQHPGWDVADTSWCAPMADET